MWQIFSLIRFSSIAVLLIASSMIQAQESGVKKGDYQPGDLNLDVSRVYIFVDKTNNLGHSHGVEGKLKAGQMLADSQSPSKLVFDMRSFVADTETARKVFGIEASIDAATVKKVNQNMLGKEILDVQRFPEASLDKASLKKTGKQTAKGLDEYQLEGDFTLHGVSRHVVIPCDMEVKDGWHHLRGRFTIRQTDFGIKPYTKAFGAVGIKDELVIMGDLWVVPSK
jgi:polyisoprenoid-binding protein YceI